MQGSKRFLAVACRTVALGAYYQIDCELAPWTHTGMFREYFTECLGLIGLGIGYGSVYALLNLVDGHGGAVVIKEIIAVFTVFRPAVLNKQGI